MRDVNIARCCHLIAAPCTYLFCVPGLCSRADVKQVCSGLLLLTLREVTQHKKLIVCNVSIKGINKTINS